MAPTIVPLPLKTPRLPEILREIDAPALKLVDFIGLWVLLP
jgi:hypothetical protein